MGKVFGRDHNPLHVLDPILGATNASPEDRAMVWNMREDWRVQQEREDKFVPFVVGRSGRALEDGITSYYRTHVSIRNGSSLGPTPHFLLPELNGKNLFDRFNSPNETLVYVLDLGARHKEIRQALADPQANINGKFRPLSSVLPSPPGTKQQWVQEIDLQRAQMADHEFQAWVRLCVDAIGSQAGRPWRPVWVTTLFTLSQALAEVAASPALSPPSVDAQKQTVKDAPPIRWTQLVGVPQHFPTWLVVLAYGEREVPRLCRPTMLETDWYPEHYPSPEAASQGGYLGGHPVDLREQPAARHLTCEYVHPQIIFSAEHMLTFQRLPGPVGRNLEAVRQNHKNLLISTYPN